MPGDATILDHAQTCMVLFDDLLSTINGKSRPDPDAELSAQADDQAGRFSIWAGNIGVFATVNASLDYRVRDTPQIKGLIIQQLGGLTKFLQRTIGIAQHETWHAIPQVAGTAETEEDAGSSISSAPDSSSMSDSVESESASFTRSPMKEGIKDVEKTISRLYRLSTTIRKSAVQNRKTKAANYVDRDESGHDMSSEFEKYATRLVKQEYPDMSQVLCERLGYANSLRRRQFLYRQRHQQKLSLGTKSRVSQGGTELMPEPSVLTPGTRDGAHSLSKDLQFGHSPAVREDGKSALLSQTMAPALEIRSIRPGGALSMVSTAITASPVQGSFDVLSPPQLTARAKEFQCPYCCLMLPAKEASPSRWRHHVKKDLEPYVCMFEECAEPHKLFSTTADWLAHMQWEHTLQWRCNARGHPPQVFDREQDFENHMRSSHAGTFSESQLPVLKRRGAQPTPEIFFSCPLCGYIPSECPEELNNGKQSEDLLNHVAAHLQDIALVSLPWRGDLEGIASSNTTSAPKARDSILDLQDERSVSSFEDTPHEFTDDIESIDEDRVSTLDREFREHEGHMTDPILISSAPIQGLVKLTEETANYIRNTVRMSEMRKKLLEEFEFIGETLVFLKRRPEAAQPEDAFLQKFVKTANPDKGLSADGTILLIEIFAQLRRCLANIQDEITTKPSNKKLLGERARHSDGNQAEMLLDNLSRISVHIKQILSQDHPTLNSSGVEASLRNQRETYSGQLSESLSPLDFTARQEHIFRDSFGNGGWFLETQEFKAWVSGRPWTLFVYGNPGVGKTVLSSIVVHHLQEMSKTENILILCMYVDYNDTGKQTLENLFGSLVRQLVQYYPSISLSTDMAKPMKKIGKEFGRRKLKDIISVLDSEIQKFPRVYLIVDALDECEVTIRNELELQIKDLQSSRLSVMITSRYLGIPSAVHVDCDVCGKEDLRLFYHCGICNEGNFDLCQNCVDKQESCKDESHSLLLEPYFAVEINLVTPDEEIRRFVDFGLEYTGKSPQGDPDERCARRPTAARLARKCRRDPVLKSWISSAVVSQAKGNFLFAKLYMDCLEQQHTVKQVKEILQNPFVLENHYEPTMVRINSQPKEDSALAKKAISWIVSSRRPLKVEELQQAMAIVPGTEEINPETSCEIPHLLSVTAGFMTVDSKHTVRLAHQTAQTYLGLQAKKWFPSVEVDIALAIVSYLRIKAISKPCLGSRDGQEFKARRKTHPFLLYAAVYWSNHVRDVIHDPIVQATVLRFVRDPSNLASCFQAASWAVATGGPNEWHPWGSPNILHECAKSGLTPIIPELLADGYGIDSQDSTYGLTALSYACRAGYGETVKLLLDLGASVNIRGLNGTTALFEAIWGGHTDLVELLLTKAELNINTVYASRTQRTVLMIAAQDGAEEVVRCLLQRVDLDINKSDISRSTALILAAANGHTSVVSLLLNHEGIKIDRRDLVGRSALIAAADNGFSEIVGRLLAKGADLHSSRTVIQRAVQLGYFFVVETMAAHGVDIRALNGLGRSLLHDAALRGSDDIVRLLILKGLDLNAQCHQGCTPLHYASRSDMFSVTKVLLELGADPSFKDNYGRTLVVVAWQEGHMRVARILEGQDSTAGRGEEIPTGIAKTLPIWSVAKLGRVDLLASILSNGTILGEKDPYTNNSAVHLAVSWNHYDILEMLLDADLSPNCINDEHETPLHFAARIANIEAVELLLQHRADIGSVDLFGDTPLQIALEEDHLSVAIQLIHGSLNTTKDIQIEISKEYVQPLFFSAVKAGNAKVLECLIDKGAHIMAKDQDGHTALQLAETAGFGDITETLETRLDIFKYKKRVTLLKNIEE